MTLINVAVVVVYGWFRCCCCCLWMVVVVLLDAAVVVVLLHVINCPCLWITWQNNHDVMILFYKLVNQGQLILVHALSHGWIC